MTPENVLMIPHLSKELNLFGLPTLPYNLVKKREDKTKNKLDQNSPNIVFNSKTMIESLINVCFELIKQIKSVGSDEDDTLDKLNFEKIKLEKQLKLCKSEIEKNNNALQAAHRKNEDLKENISLLENKIKDYQIKLKTVEKKSQTDKYILEHALKKKELDILDSYMKIRRQCHPVEQYLFQNNCEMAQLNQTDFSKLWSKVKYSDPKTREECLKEAVCIFQQNNKALIEETFILKSTLSNVLQKINQALQFMFKKFQIPASALPSFKEELFWSSKGFSVPEFNKILDKHIEVFTETFKSLDQVSFVVSDNTFVCISDIFKNLKIS